jgi:hypothetical protein
MILRKPSCIEKREAVEFSFYQGRFMGISALIEALPEKKKQILIGTSSVIGGLVILIAYFQSGPTALTYAKAESAFSSWEASPEDEALYQSMKEAIRLVPALEKKYEAAIAQKLLDTDRLHEALRMANHSLDRIKGEIPFHAAFAGATLLIEEEKYQEALENAVALKEWMGPSFLLEPKSGSLLYAHNLLRIASLQKELRNQPGEKAAWAEVESLLETKSPLASAILSSFTDKQVNLTHYIAERKKFL